MWVQIAVWQTTVPPEAARMTGPDGALALIDPAASTSATEASGVPVGAASDAAAAVVGSAAAVVGSAAVGAAAAEVAAFDVAADEAAAGLVVEVVELVLELQAAAAASTAVPEAAKTVRRGRLRGAGVTAGVLQGLVRRARLARRITFHSYLKFAPASREVRFSGMILRTRHLAGFWEVSVRESLGSRKNDVSRINYDNPLVIGRS